MNTGPARRPAAPWRRSGGALPVASLLAAACRRFPLVVPLALAVAMSMVLISEGTYRHSIDALDKLDEALPPSPSRAATLAERAELRQTLLLGRIGIAGLSGAGLLLLTAYLRQARRGRLGAEVVQRAAQLTELTRHLQAAREEERNRLARDLHDELGSLLTSAKLDAARIRARLGNSAPEALERLTHLVEALNSGIALKRRIIEDLRPSALSHLGLVATLEILAREFAERSGLQVHCALEPVGLDASSEIMVYRLVQEATTNIAKYAQATQVWLTLAARGKQVELSVRDNGVGFDATARPNSAYGLLGMRFRVEAEGGHMELVSLPGYGTSIRATVPMSGVAQQQA